MCVVGCRSRWEKEPDGGQGVDVVRGGSDRSMEKKGWGGLDGSRDQMEELSGISPLNLVPHPSIWYPISYLEPNPTHVVHHSPFWNPTPLSGSTSPCLVFHPLCMLPDPK